MFSKVALFLGSVDHLAVMPAGEHGANWPVPYSKHLRKVVL
jgi:hypothetical protein